MDILINKHDKNINKSMITSIKEDLNSVIFEEFYDGRRTPSYAVRFLHDAVENHPTIESCLVHGQYLSLASRNYTEKRIFKPNQISFNRRSDNIRKYSPNTTHRYLTNTELIKESTNNHLGKPTRATLLKERMNYNGSNSKSAPKVRERQCQSANLCNILLKKGLSKEVWQRNTFDCNVNHGFLVGARYNSAHFLDLNCVRDKGLYVSKNNPGIVFINSSNDQLVGSEIASPPNSPQSNHELLQTSPYFITKGIIPRTIIHHQSQSCIQNKNPKDIQIGSSFKSEDVKQKISRPHTAGVMQDTSSHKGLPIVIGSKWMSGESLNSTSRPISSVKTAWTRTAVNLHFSKQNRFLQNRFHGDFRSRNFKVPVTFQSSSPEPEAQRLDSFEGLQCTKLDQKSD